MPLPPALLAKLAKRGIINSKNIKVAVQQNDKENLKEDEEIIAENYDETDNKRDFSVDEGDEINESVYESEELKAHIEAKFKGYPGCPNKYNVWHECTLFCKEFWGEGKKKPARKYLYFRKKMLEKYPLPENWVEVYDSGTGRYYYWDEENDVVSWLPPSHPRALITDSAAHFREERHMVEGDKHSEGSDDEESSSDSSDSSVELKRKKSKYGFSEKDGNKSDDEREKYSRNNTNKIEANSRYRGKNKSKQNDLDPMDPASYSDIPRGSWADGLNKGIEAKTGADTTASGPLYQMRPYPSPGAVLRVNAKSKESEPS